MDVIEKEDSRFAFATIVSLRWKATSRGTFGHSAIKCDSCVVFFGR